MNGRYAKNRLTEERGFYFFYFRSRAGVYNLQPVAYRLRRGDEELIIEGPTRRAIVYPSIKGVGLKSSYEVRAFRKITLEEVKPLLPKLKEFIINETGAKEVYLTGSLASKGYSYHDVDFLVDVRIDYGMREMLRHKLRKLFCLNAEVFDFMTYKKVSPRVRL